MPKFSRERIEEPRVSDEKNNVDSFNAIINYTVSALRNVANKLHHNEETSPESETKNDNEE